MTANLDVSALYDFCRTHSLSFSLAALYASLLTANELREFRIRFMGDQLVEFDTIHATQTILNDDDETFSFAYFEMKNDLMEFDSAGKAARDKYKRLRSLDVETGRLDLMYYSVIPWVSFTSFKHASRLDKRMSVPRIVFGKIYGGSQKLMPVSVEANHAIMDGIHVGRFYQRFQSHLDDLAISKHHL
jgi:chloramphenicol O-acetyltransferase type A